MNMLNSRQDIFYCHLTLMEFYERVFIVMWIFLALLILLGSCTVVVMLFLPLPFVARLLLRTAGATEDLCSTQKVLIRELGFGDIFVLYLLKSHVADTDFAKILLEVRQIVENCQEIETSFDENIEVGGVLCNTSKWCEHLECLEKS